MTSISKPTAMRLAEALDVLRLVDRQLLQPQQLLRHARQLARVVEHVCVELVRRQGSVEDAQLRRLRAPSIVGTAERGRKVVRRGASWGGSVSALSTLERLSALAQAQELQDRLALEPKLNRDAKRLEYLRSQ